MSHNWNPSLYRTHDAQSSPPDQQTIPSLMQAVDDCTKRLKFQPHDSKSWIERAACFLKFNFPELAASDAYKAELLLNEDKHALSVANTDDTRFRIHDVLGQALFDCHCHWELAEHWDQVSARFPSDHASAKAASMKTLLKRKIDAVAPLGGTLQEQKDRIRDGGVVTVDYPWLETRHLVRSQEVIDTVNKELSSHTGQQKCYLAQSSLSSVGDMLGMFAARDLRSGESFLLDRTATSACSNTEEASCDNCFARIVANAVPTSCCAVLYCSPECHNLALVTYHVPLCGQDFTWLQAPAAGLTHNASPLRVLLMLRFLATCIQSGPSNHPLNHPLIARLQPLANRGHVDVFTFTESIVTPIKILQQFGIDVFANQRFDAMILHTIWTRIANNKAGSFDPRRGFVDVISPHLPLFNHSCEPNVGWKREQGSSSIYFFAKKDVKKGKELFSSYLDVEDISLEKRTQGLWPWFEGECLCSRCVREKADLRPGQMQ
jgi:hypothetical protein